MSTCPRFTRQSDSEPSPGPSLRRRGVRAGGAIVGTLIAAAVLIACGGGSKNASNAVSAPASPSQSGDGAGRGFGGSDLFTDPKVQQCLSAAGVAIPSLTARPSGDRSDFPSFSSRPTGTFSRPPGASGRPSGAPSGGGFLGGQEGQQIQQALTACGLSLTPRSGAPAPTATPSG